MTEEQLVPEEQRREILNRGFLPLAVAHTQDSLRVAQALLDAGFPSAAFVWATRSAEIFMREALLFPLAFEESGDVRASFAEARDFFASGKWSRAIRRARDAYGLHGTTHEALTETGDDAFDAWARDFVGPRGEIVHGRAEADAEMAAVAIAFADRMREWFTIRIITAESGPFAGALYEVFEQARAIYEEERSRATEQGEPEE